MPIFHVTFSDLLHAVKLRHGTEGFTFPPKEGVLRIFFRPKNPTASKTWVPAASRPPKSLTLARYCYAVRHGKKVQLVTP
jgi:hypothetical protein